MEFHNTSREKTTGAPSREALPAMLLGNLEPVLPVLAAVGVRARVAFDARAALHFWARRRRRLGRLVRRSGALRRLPHGVLLHLEP
eukprot:1342352-Prymnesium_polylepis.1